MVLPGGSTVSPRTPAENAQLALLLEVASTPKPGNVDRRRDLPGLRFEHFLAGAVGAHDGLIAGAGGTPVGEAFEQAVAGMSNQSGGNTQFGALLLLVPLVKAASASDHPGETIAASAAEIVDATTVADAAAFYRAFEHVDVAVGDLPESITAPDVRRGANAVSDLEDRGLTLSDVLAESATVDGVARECVEGFPRSIAVADAIQNGAGPVSDRAARAFLAQLAREPDTHVAKRHGEKTAHNVMVRTQEARESDDPGLVEAFAESLVEAGINPGTTADLVAAGLFIALERGVEV